MQRLVNEEISELKEKMSDYQETISQAIYEQFKTATVLGNTNSLRGKTGDSFKGYVNTVHLNLTQKIINIAEEIQQAINQMETTFLEYESHKSGIVESDTLQQVAEKVEDSNTAFDTLDAKSSDLLSRASEFIATTSLPSSSVNSAYRNSIDQIKNDKDDLNETDVKATKDLNDVKDRVDSLEQQIKDLLTVYRHNDGIHYDKIGNITSESWYSDENNARFATMVEDDPFVYDTSTSSKYENQWVTGIDGDTFLSGDIATLNKETMSKVEDGVTTNQGHVNVFQGNIDGQFSEYATTQGSLSVLEAGGNISYGNGIALNGHAHGAQAEGSLMIGTDNFNGYVNGRGDALSAEGNFVIEPPNDNGDYTYNIGGNAALLKGEADIGFSLFGIDDVSGTYEDSNSGMKKEKSLLGVDLSGSIGIQAGAEFESSRVTAFETEYVDVNANTLKVDLALLAGLKVDLQYPTISINWPW